MIRITPFAPRAPYKAADAASFNTVIDSISWLLIVLRSPSNGAPSRITNGAFPALIEPIPLILTDGDDCPGWPLLLKICIRVVLPTSASIGFETCNLLISSAFTTEAEPVNADFFCVPKATTITSSRSLASCSKTTFTFPPLTVTVCGAMPT